MARVLFLPPPTLEATPVVAGALEAKTKLLPIATEAIDKDAGDSVDVSALLDIVVGPARTPLEAAPDGVTPSPALAAVFVTPKRQGLPAADSVDSSVAAQATLEPLLVLPSDRIPKKRRAQRQCSSVVFGALPSALVKTKSKCPECKSNNEVFSQAVSEVKVVPWDCIHCTSRVCLPPCAARCPVHYQ